MRLIYKMVNRLAAELYAAAVRTIETPDVLTELSPRFKSDKIIAPAVGDRFAIVVKYALFGMTEDFLHLLAALRRQNVNPIVVCNGDIDDSQLEKVSVAAHRVLIRRNIGRDFGAYRAATLFMHKNDIRPSRLLYLNDSVMFVNGPGLDAMVGALVNSEYDVVGAFENHEFIHHVGSYALSVNGKVFADPRIHDFWQRYRPYSLRPHAIRKGELAFSECLMKCGYKTDVVYSAEKLALRLDKMPLPELVEKLRYAPYGALRTYDLKALLSGAAETGEMLRGPPEQKSGRTPTIGEYALALKSHANPGNDRGRRALIADQILRESLVNYVMNCIVNGSQVHYGFGLFHRVMDSPLIKRDLLIRGLLLEHDCARILDYMPAHQREGIMRELLNRGRPLKFHGVRAFKLRNGFI